MTDVQYPEAEMCLEEVQETGAKLSLWISSCLNGQEDEYTVCKRVLRDIYGKCHIVRNCGQQ